MSQRPFRQTYNKHYLLTAAPNLKSNSWEYPNMNTEEGYQNKCVFAGPSVEYLGHIITPASNQANPGKISAIQMLPVPGNLKNLQSFGRTYFVQA